MAEYAERRSKRLRDDKMIFLYIAVVLIALYIIFAAAPAVFIFRMIFSRKENSKILSRRDLIGSRYEPYMAELIAADEFIRSRVTAKVSITARDGVVLYGDYLDNHSDRTVIFVHGYCGNPISNFCLQARHLYDLGFNMLFICQRAHGESGGKRNGLGIIEQYDVLKWIEYEEIKPHINKILLYGSSMGSSAVAYSSDKIKSEKVKGMVIDCAFSSVGDQLYYDSRKRKIPPFLVIPVIRLIARIEFKEDIYKQCGESLAKAKIPALFIHATGDTTVPYKFGLKNYNACAQPKELITVEGSQHIVEYTAGGEQTKRGLISFTEKYC